MKIRRITVLILLLLTALLVVDVRFFSSDQRSSGNSSITFEIKPAVHTNQVERTVEFSRTQADLTAITITNQLGVVEVATSEGAELSVIATISAPSEKQLAEWEIQEKLVGTEIRYELVSKDTRARQNIGVTYNVKIPAQMMATIKQQYGLVDVKNFAGELAINSRFGQVNVDGLEGAGTVSNSFGSIDLRNIAGSLTIDDAYSTSTIQLVPIAEGYEFEIAVLNGSLQGSAPLDIRRDQQQISATGRSGAGMHPIKITSKFGSVTLDLRD